MRSSIGEKFFYLCNYILLGFVGLSCVLPLVHIAALSLSSNHAVLSGEVYLWPKQWTWDAYLSVIAGTNIVRSSWNSIVITVIGTVLNMVLTVAAAYPLSRKYFLYRRFFTLAILFTMLFSAGLIPNYLLIRSLGFVDTYWALWLPGIISVYNLLVLRTFFENIPEELVEASRIDGCGEFRLLAQIVLPLSTAVLATLTLFYGVAHWNSFFPVLIYINDSQKYNLAVQVQQMIQNNSLLQQMNQVQPEDLQQLTPESIKAASIMFLVIPMLVIYPLLQKYFVKGFMIGAVKG